MAKHSRKGSIRAFIFLVLRIFWFRAYLKWAGKIGIGSESVWAGENRGKNSFMRKIVLSTVAVTCLAAVSACGENSADSDSTPAQSAEPEIELTFAELTGDAAAGELVFAQCRTCHMLEAGENGIGPALYGVIGRKAGSSDGFAYSAANAEAEFIWTPEVMFDYLESPREYLPGTRMAFPGVKDAQDRANLVAYLESNGG